MRKIEAARKRKGLTRQELADAVGVTYAAIARYETGVRVPRLAVLRKIAEVLECKPGDLVD